MHLFKASYFQFFFDGISLLSNQLQFIEPIRVCLGFPTSLAAGVLTSVSLFCGYLVLILQFLSNLGESLHFSSLYFQAEKSSRA